MTERTAINSEERPTWSIDYHGMPGATLEPSYEQGSYLAFLGRTSPEKGLDQAIAIARRSRLPLKVAAKVDSVDAG